MKIDLLPLMNSNRASAAVIVGSALLLSAGMLLSHSQRQLSESPEIAIPGIAGRWHGNEPTQEPLARLQSLARKSDPIEQGRAAIVLLDHLSPSDFPVLLDRYRSMEPAPSADTIQLLLSAWTKISPSDAANYAASHGGALKTVILAWCAADPQAALAWTTAKVTGEAKGPLLATILPCLSSSDPARISEVLSGLSEKGRNEVMKSFANALAQQSAGATIQWLGSIGNPQWHYEALTAVIQSASPDQAIEWMKRYTDELQSHEDGLNVHALFESWATRDPDAANAAFEKLPPGTAMHHQALEWLVGNRQTRENPADAVALLDRFPDEADDEVMASLSRASLRKAPELAADIMLKVQRPHADLLMVISSWWQTDPSAAKSWLDTHPIPEDLKPFLPKDLLKNE